MLLLINLYIIIQYKFFHFVEHRRQSLVVLLHKRYWDFQSNFRNFRPLLSLLVDLHSLKSIGKVKRSPLDDDPSYHILLMFLAKKWLWRWQTDRGHWSIQASFKDFLLSLTSKMTSTHETHSKHISFRIEMLWLIRLLVRNRPQISWYVPNMTCWSICNKLLQS